jgi:hypothetical protein
MQGERLLVAGCFDGEVRFLHYFFLSPCVIEILLNINSSSRSLARRLQCSKVYGLHRSSAYSVIYVADGAEKPLRAMSMLDVAGSTETVFYMAQYAGQSMSTSCCPSSKCSLFALANNVIQQPLCFLVQSCFMIFALSLLIITAIVESLARRPSSLMLGITIAYV